MMSETDEFVVLTIYFDLLIRKGLFRLNMHQLPSLSRQQCMEGLESKMNIGFSIRTFWQLIKNYIS
jgi:hypothetical protein